MLLTSFEEQMGAGRIRLLIVKSLLCQQSRGVSWDENRGNPDVASDVAKEVVALIDSS
jgi:hypothetical protein